MNNGKLFVVATPIGNLGDITFRAVETLKSVDFIICEDTRVTSVLLNHLEISKPLVVINAHNESKSLERVVERISANESAALVSDAGTPCISDPGIRLVNFAIEKGIEVIGIPGANAAIMALSISGLPTDSFVFEGFLPQKKGRQKKLLQLAEEERTIVLYESTYRIEKLLEELKEYLPTRQIVVGRELTKKFEETWRGTAGKILTDFEKRNKKGEFVLVIAPLNWKTNSPLEKSNEN
ncbi:MAG: 16S rRNA (cytidine1402-2'-O)-methyltransferase [Ignavibacteria bacterium]|nr:MAG: 16S rRNA (cytidine1402-2'-O)-methyltransferase [Ignavibacteria bacterium]KAF0161954.1 MAG: 16S rRNA (cytidine1402-2'-O)-methyltransferase [Ignavibacteria bacterium]